MQPHVERWVINLQTIENMIVGENSNVTDGVCLWMQTQKSRVCGDEDPFLSSSLCIVFFFCSRFGFFIISLGFVIFGSSLSFTSWLSFFLHLFLWLPFLILELILLRFFKFVCYYLCYIYVYVNFSSYVIIIFLRYHFLQVNI